MPFGEVERIISVPLAPSARMYLPYWYSTQDSLAKAIAAAGYKACGVNLTSERLVLVRR
jgi:hypothetical protein